MVADGALPGPSAWVGRQRSFADMVANTQELLLEIDVPFRPAKIIDREFCILFSKEEVDKSADPFRFLMVLKFLRQRPSLDAI